MHRILINFRESDVSNCQQKERGHEYERRVPRHQWTCTACLDITPLAYLMPTWERRISVYKLCRQVPPSLLV